MTTINQQRGRASESGNVLFLILIAVALFAALSYAVTQSSRSGGGDTGEKTLVSSSQITQYPSGIRTAIVRMIIAGTGVEDLIFDDPSNFSTLEAAGADTEKKSVFYPTPGGGATYSLAPPDAMASGTQGTWIFSSKYQVKNIGSNVAGTGNDVIAFLNGVSKGLCTKIDTQLGIALNSGDAPTLSELNTPPAAADNMSSGTGSATGGPGIPASATAVIGNTSTGFAGQPFGCGKITGGYIYYHVLVER